MKRIIAAAFTAIFLLTGCNNASKNTSLTGSGGTGLQEITNCDMTEYPEDNIFGLRSVGEADNGSNKTISFSFAKLKKAVVNSSIMSESKSITGHTHYGSFVFDDIEVTDKGKYFDVVLNYDSRIELTCVSFNYEDKRCNIYVDEGLKLVYCDFADVNISKTVSQEYNTEKMSWDESYNREESQPKEDGNKPVIDTVKDVDYEDEAKYPVNTYGNLKFKATKYRYINESYNLYGEVTQPAKATLQFDFVDEKNPVDVTVNESDIKLYKKIEGEYTEITPEDISLTLNAYNDGRNLSITVESSTLGDLEEGDYRGECGKYYVDFAIATHTYEVW